MVSLPSCSSQRTCSSHRAWPRRRASWTDERSCADPPCATPRSVLRHAPSRARDAACSVDEACAWTARGTIPPRLRIRCCATSRCPFRRAGSRCSWDEADPANPRCCTSWPAFTRRTKARCTWTDGWQAWNDAWNASAWCSSSRSGTCWAARSEKSSRSAGHAAGNTRRSARSGQRSCSGRWKRSAWTAWPSKDVQKTSATDTSDAWPSQRSWPGSRTCFCWTSRSQVWIGEPGRSWSSCCDGSNARRRCWWPLTTSKKWHPL
mmetsp:Transcript_5908/g.36633  ORF Transcript_5908/g.36633 Transcript_5908/m.36633 type:complete len:263 (-) Transcript_5908:1538-2326(-)